MVFKAWIMKLFVILFSSGPRFDVRVVPWRKLSTEELVWSMVLERTLESPLYCKEMKSVNPKGNQSWIFTGRTDAEAETPILWPHDAKNWLIGKDPDAAKDWRQEEKGTTEDVMVGGIMNSLGMSLSKLQELMKDRRAGLLQSMGLQRVSHDWGTELNWTYLCSNINRIGASQVVQW